MTNNIRAERLERAWLRVTEMSGVDNTRVVRGELFDGSPFDFTIPSHQIERCDGNASLVEVGYVGDHAGFSEIILPTPVLHFGHNIRVKPESLVKWQEITKLRELKDKK